MEKIIIYCSCNEDYINRVKILYNSLQKNININYEFIVRTVGFDPKKYSFFDDKKTIQTDDVVLSKEKTLLSLDNHYYSEEQAYSAKIRFIDIFNLLNTRSYNILSLDADSIVRYNLDNLDNLLKHNDILAHLVLKSAKPHYRIKAGVVYAKNNDNSKRFFKHVSNYLSTGNNLTTWFSEQVALYNAYNLKLAEFSNLPMSYIDWEFNKDSIIWTAKGSTKSNPIYQLEETLYEN